MKYVTKYVLARWLRKHGYFQNKKPSEPPSNTEFMDALAQHTGQGVWTEEQLESLLQEKVAEDPSIRTRRMRNPNAKSVLKADRKRINAMNRAAQPASTEQLKSAMDSLYNRADYEAFINSEAWRSLRYVAIRLLGNKCRACGNSPATGAVLHVDHITPCSVDWSRRLDLLNLQVLCKDCNLGKSNLFEDDWREA